MKSGEGTFKYKGCTTVPPLSFIDDVLGITECSVKSVQLNRIEANAIPLRFVIMGRRIM